jgi:hypothetical protein
MPIVKRSFDKLDKLGRKMKKIKSSSKMRYYNYS